MIINRAKKTGKTPCQVVRQPGQFKYRTGSGSQWQESLRAAKNLGRDITGGSYYFKAKYARVRNWPYKLVVTIGNHLFYK